MWKTVTTMKEMEEGLNKWRDIPRLWTDSLLLTRPFFPLHLQIPLTLHQKPGKLACSIDKLILKFTREGKRPIHHGVGEEQS
jgi:hypothetical protein